MKIMIVGPHFDPMVGGVETYIKQLAKQFVNQNDQVVVVTAAVPNAPDLETIDGVTVYRLPVQIRLSNTPMSFGWGRRLRQIIKAEQPDVVNAHAPVPFLADVAAHVCHRLKVPFVTTYHAGSMKKGALIPDLLIGLYENVFLPKLFKKSARIAAVYPAFVKAHTPSVAHKVTFAPPGVDTELFTSPVQPIKNSDPTILFVGRIDKTSAWKGIGMLIDALPAVLAAHPTARLQIVGSGDAVDEYKAQAQQLGVADNVTFTGARFGNELIRTYQAADVLVLPSTTNAESFGMVLAEALACGTPVIGSNIGGIPQVINSTGGGLLVEPKQPELLAKALSQLLSDPAQRQQLAAAGQQAVRQLYTWKKLKNTYQHLYQGAIERKPELIQIVGYYPPHLGGMERVVHELALRLAGHDQPLQVITSDIGTRNIPPHDEDLPNYAVRRLHGFVFAHTPIIPSLFWTLLRASRNSIFHVHVAQAGIPEAALLAAKLRRIPIVMHIHCDVEASGAAGVLLPYYKKLFLGPTLKHANRVIVLTDIYKSLMEQRYGLKKPPVIIPNGVDKQFFTEKSARLSASSHTKLLFVGRMAVEKNVPLLVKAVHLVPEPIEFTMVGDGPLYNEVRALTEQDPNTKHRFNLVGRKAHRELADYYQDSDLFVLASDYESQSLVVLEALASSTPVIVSDMPTLNEIIGDAGLHVKKTPEAFAQAISGLIQNPDRAQKMAAAGRTRAEAFSWEHALAKIRDVYTSL